MAFQRSYSKVWWASDDSKQNGRSFTSGGFYKSYSQLNGIGRGPQRQFSSIDVENVKPYSGNLSRIQEVDDENISKLLEKHDSPGSLRSQDSGFSDNDESHSNRSVGDGHSPNCKMDSSQNGNCFSVLSTSPMSSTIHTIETPPTVIRRQKPEFYSPLVHVSRRISFNGGATTTTTNGDQVPTFEPETNDNSGNDLQIQIDGISFMNNSTIEEPMPLSESDTSTSDRLSPCKCSESVLASRKDKSIRRRRRIVSRKSSLLLTPKHRSTSETNLADETDGSLDDNNVRHSPIPDYNNETVYLGIVSSDGGNNYKLNQTISTRRNHEMHHCSRFPIVNTSTPKKNQNTIESQHQFTCNEYDNPLLNGHFPALQSWLDDTRMSYEHEVMSTLQTKSIAQEAFKNMTITTNTVAKIIRQLQQRAIILQSEFEKVERTLQGGGGDGGDMYDALVNAKELVGNVAEFTKVLERRVVFFTECRADRKKFEDHIEHIKMIVKDTRISLEKHLYIQLDSLLDDVQVLKRHILITVRLVFEKLVRIIVQSVEQSKCDLMLRANINMIATLSNIDYEGFASLSAAFVHNETVRTLLIVCLENRSSSVRALALRALATVCGAPEAITQLGQAEGTEIIRDILQVEKIKSPINSVFRRSDAERREAVSLLTQITASWHGAKHRVDGLRDSVESIVEGLTDIITKTNCCQTLLLCAASLNNLSRIEPTSVYSIMSNETIIKLKDAVIDHGSSVSIFLYEQIISMLHNMSGNKKCHSHLANSIIINFITFIFESEFYKKYRSRAESESQRHTIKNILHAFTRLIHESSLGPEILAQNSIPIFSKATAAAATATSSNSLMPIEDGIVPGTNSTCSAIDYDGYGKEISVLARHLMIVQNESTTSSLSRKSPAASPAASPEPVTSMVFDRSTEIRNSGCSSSALKFNLTRQESYV